VLDLLEDAQRTPVVFHWYSGSLQTLDRALAEGHYFSINPSMTASPNGQKVIARLPPDRVLTETDAPFVKIGTRVAEPMDVSLVEDYLVSQWKMKKDEVRIRIKENFLAIVRPIRAAQR
jgi:TatD DNase family protein